MKPFYQLNREVITIGGIEWNITTHSVDMTAWHLMYTKGIREPNYPVPAIRYETVFPWEDSGYAAMIYVNDIGCEWDPILVCCWDFYLNDEWCGKYQHCYNDADAAWYYKHGAWNGSLSETHSWRDE